MNGSIRVGVDAGGTFTDFVTSDGRELKLPSRPDDPASVVLEGLATLRIEGAVEVVFSTTAATNALLTRRGGPTKLFTTDGFEDVLEIARQTRPELYALVPQKRPALLGVEDRHGVKERVGADGGVLVALDDAEVTRVAALVPPGTTVAICFLHGYRAPEHEAKLAAHLRALGHVVSVSSEAAPLPREYERTSTTVIDAYVAPALGATLERLRSRVTLRVMESSGGARASNVRPARTVLSGPAAGVVAAERLAQRLGLDHVIALDIGGTSTDLALVRGGRAARVEELMIDGMPIALPSIAVATVGAGGGSIAWLDPGGALKVGPRSAGATPGPACYGRGGAEPTVTDAHVVLGTLGTSICGGSVHLDVERARFSMGPLAAALAISVEDVAEAIVTVMNASVARALEGVALGEPREALTLVAYGGASGLHAVDVARRCGIGSVLVPPAPGLFCATGARDAHVVTEAIIAMSSTLAGTLSDAVERELSSLRERVGRELDVEAAARARTITTTVRARYVGQGIDGELELPSDGFDVARFESAHRAAYGHVLERPIEITGLRARGYGFVEETASVRTQAAEVPAAGHASFSRASLAIGVDVAGPARIDELSGTLWLPAGAAACLDERGNLLVSPGVS